jgi:hypothetical protein
MTSFTGKCRGLVRGLRVFLRSIVVNGPQPPPEDPLSGLPQVPIDWPLHGEVEVTEDEERPEWVED